MPKGNHNKLKNYENEIKTLYKQKEKQGIVLVESMYKCIGCGSNFYTEGSSNSSAICELCDHYLRDALMGGKNQVFQVLYRNDNGWVIKNKQLDKTFIC